MVLRIRTGSTGSRSSGPEARVQATWLFPTVPCTCQCFNIALLMSRSESRTLWKRPRRGDLLFTRTLNIALNRTILLEKQPIQKWPFEKNGRLPQKREREHQAVLPAGFPPHRQQHLSSSSLRFSCRSSTIRDSDLLSTWWGNCLVPKPN